FFKVEDGIRDRIVTGVQTCAIPILEDFNNNIEEVDEAVELIDEYGEQQYNRQIEEYIRQTMLRDRVAQELEEELIEENPEAIEEEINYLLEDKYDDLLMDQMSTLEMDIHLQ